MTSPGSSFGEQQPRLHHLQHHLRNAQLNAPPLAFDVGMNNGDDTALLLMHGYRVLAIDADPRFVHDAATRFADALADGRLQLVNVALAMKMSHQKLLTFFVNQHSSEWSSFDERTGCRVKDWSVTRVSRRHPDNCIALPINASRCRTLFHTYGVPKLLKVDVEGAEMACIGDLQHFRQRPAYVVQEALHPRSVHWNQSFAMFELLGYTGFKWVNQRNFQGVWGRSSGPFGEFGIDCEWQWKWRPLRSLRRLVSSLRLKVVSGTSARASCEVWADLHARHRLMERPYGAWGRETESDATKVRGLSSINP